MIIKRHIGILYLIVTVAIFGCNKASVNDHEILSQLENEILKRGQEYSDKELQSADIVVDTFQFYDIKTTPYRLVLAQYSTGDKQLDLSILGIDNFKQNGLSIPTYVLVDYGLKSYLIDSLDVQRDSLQIYLTSKKSNQLDRFHVSFDLNFNGSSFPWKVEYK